MGKWMLPALVAVVALGLAPASALGATTIGVANPSNGGLTNTGSCTSLQCTYLPFQGSGPAYVSPVTGTIVRWRIAADSSGSQVTLRVLRPASGGAFTAVASSAVQSTTGGKVDTFTTNLQINAGDAIGLDNGSDALMFKENVLGQFPKFHTPFLADGSTASFSDPNSGDNGKQLQINADVEPASGGGGGGGGGGVGGGGTVVIPPGTPVLSKLTIKPPRFRVGARATISFQLSQAARYTLRFNRLVPGRKRGKRCLPQSRTVRTGARCTARRLAGTQTATGKVGANRVTFRGRLRGRALAVGPYELVAFPTASPISQQSKRFTIIPKPRRR